MTEKCVFTPVLHNSNVCFLRVVAISVRLIYKKKKKPTCMKAESPVNQRWIAKTGTHPGREACRVFLACRYLQTFILASKNGPFVLALCAKPDRREAACQQQEEKIV